MKTLGIFQSDNIIIFLSAGENGHGSVPLSDSKVKVFAKQTFENISVDKKLTSERMAELHQEKVSLLSLLDRNKLACVTLPALFK